MTDASPDTPDLPSLECDLVLAGGITSGVVFPKAALELSNKYRFRSIGGTSVGAIAAAIIASAEMGRRQSKGAFDSFKVVGETPQFLANNLFTLFQPSPKFRALFGLLDDVLQVRTVRSKSKVAAIWNYLVQFLKLLFAAMPHYPLCTVIGLVFGAVAFVPYLSFVLDGVLMTSTAKAMTILIALFSATLLLLTIATAILIGVVIDVAKLKSAGFGMCPGLTQSPGQPGLVDWIDQTMLAAVGSRTVEAKIPLTFAELKGSDPAHTIELSMMTSNLTFGTGLVLPGLGGEAYYFAEADMRDILPRYVVDYMITKAGDKTIEGPNKATLYELPKGDDLPILFAVRLSLNFPILFSAVRLYTKVFRVGVPSPELVSVLFSDGGITSNFPVRFFDSLIPSRPTFGISLDDMPAPPHTQVYLPMKAGSGRQYQPRQITGLPGFLGAIISTAREWQDRKQGRVSGYRERIAHVYLTDDEGGLNLHMPPETVNDLVGYGERAGKLLAGTASPPDSDNFDFDDHQWRRYLIAYARLEEMLEKSHEAWNGKNGKPPIRDAIKRMSQDPLSYKESSKAWRNHVLSRLDALFQYYEDTNIAPTDAKFGKGSLRHANSGKNIPEHRAKLQVVPTD